MSVSTSDPKAGERAYYVNLGEAGLHHAAGKPYSDERCGSYLADLGALLQLMKPAPASVLDLGCGTGWTSRLLARAGYDVTGVDIAPEAIAVARSLAVAEKITGVTFKVADYETLADEDAYDYVLFYDALHHAEEELTAVRAAWRALRPGGAMICFEPGSGHSHSETSKHAVEKYGVHEKDMPPRKIAALGRIAGFKRCVHLPVPHDLSGAVYHRDFHAAPNQFRLLTEKIWRIFRAVTRLLGSGKRGGLTVLWK